MSIRVVAFNTEEAKELPPIEEEEEISNDVVEQTNEEVKEEVKTEEVKEEVREEVKEEVKPRRQTQKDRISCPKCFKEMTVKSYKYTHQQNCQGQLSEKPVKPHAKPKAKQTPKPKHEVLSGQRNPVKAPPEVYYSDEEEEHKPLSKPVKNQMLKPQPINPTTALAQHYQLLQQAFIKQKQEKYNNSCQNMFSSTTKKIDLIIRF